MSPAQDQARYQSSVTVMKKNSITSGKQPPLSSTKQKSSSLGRQQSDTYDSDYDSMSYRSTGSSNYQMEDESFDTSSSSIEEDSVGYTKKKTTARRASGKKSGVVAGINLDEIEDQVHSVTAGVDDFRDDIGSVREKAQSNTRGIRDLQLQFEEARARLDRLLRKTTPFRHNSKSGTTYEPISIDGIRSGRRESNLDSGSARLGSYSSVDSPSRGSYSTMDSPRGNRRSLARDDSFTDDAFSASGRDRTRRDYDDTDGSNSGKTTGGRRNKISTSSSTNKTSTSRNEFVVNGDVSNGVHSPGTARKEISFMKTQMSQPKFDVVQLTLRRNSKENIHQVYVDQ